MSEQKKEESWNLDYFTHRGPKDVIFIADGRIIHPPIPRPIQTNKHGDAKKGGVKT
jgi:hypothetical protein